jgi:hypothetical protein
LLLLLFLALSSFEVFWGDAVLCQFLLSSCLAAGF